MPARSKTLRAQQFREGAAGAVLHDVRQDAEVLVDVGVAGAGHEVQRSRAGDHAGGFGVAERRLGRGAVQHRDRPVVAQAGLVVTEMQRARRRLLEEREAGADVVIQHRRVGERVQHRGAGELLGDGAHAEQRVRGERDAAFGVGKAPCVAQQHFAVAQRGDGTAGSGIGAGEALDHAVEACGEGAGHTVAPTAFATCLFSQANRS